MKINKISVLMVSVLIISLVGNVYQCNIIEKGIEENQQIVADYKLFKEDLNDLRVENQNLKIANHSYMNALSKYE